MASDPGRRLLSSLGLKYPLRPPIPYLTFHYYTLNKSINNDAISNPTTIHCLDGFLLPIRPVPIGTTSTCPNGTTDAGSDADLEGIPRESD